MNSSRVVYITHINGGTFGHNPDHKIVEAAKAHVDLIKKSDHYNIIYLTSPGDKNTKVVDTRWTIQMPFVSQDKRNFMQKAFGENIPEISTDAGDEVDFNESGEYSSNSQSGQILPFGNPNTNICIEPPSDQTEFIVMGGDFDGCMSKTIADITFKKVYADNQDITIIVPLDATWEPGLVPSKGDLSDRNGMADAINQWLVDHRIKNRKVSGWHNFEDCEENFTNIGIDVVILPPDYEEPGSKGGTVLKSETALKGATVSEGGEEVKSGKETKGGTRRELPTGKGIVTKSIFPSKTDRRRVTIKLVSKAVFQKIMGKK